MSWIEHKNIIERREEIVNVTIEKSQPKESKLGKRRHREPCIQQEFYVEANNEDPSVVWKVNKHNIIVGGTMTIEYNRGAKQPNLELWVNGQILTTLSYGQSFSCTLTDVREVALKCHKQESGFAAGHLTLQLVLMDKEKDKKKTVSYGCEVKELHASTKIIDADCQYKGEKNHSNEHFIDIILTGEGILYSGVEGKRGGYVERFPIFSVTSIRIDRPKDSMIEVSETCRTCRVYEAPQNKIQIILSVVLLLEVSKSVYVPCNRSQW
ncbi:S-Ena type endospore appendage [Bacillus sp. FJAT-45037]|uniref:S-Ena type endospore appendage n=1 Tax=Bacillus sp. FJAT-45037 TaxID=2011007 RepID=UPI0012FDDBB6|nr:S-Ena type endospore appendage [Bacillus sp. FJAT-45037]